MGITKSYSILLLLLHITCVCLNVIVHEEESIENKVGVELYILRFTRSPALPTLNSVLFGTRCKSNFIYRKIVPIWLFLFYSTLSVVLNK